MTTLELHKFIKQNIAEQGSASSLSLTTLVLELAKHIPLVLHLNGEKIEESDNKTIYKLADHQEEIDAIIDSAVNSEECDICVSYNGMTVHFSHIEAYEDILTAYHIIDENKSLEVYLTKEEGLSEVIYIHGTAKFAAFSDDFNFDFLKK